MNDHTSVSLLHRLRNPRDNSAWARFDAQYRRFIVTFLRQQNVDEHLAEDICQDALRQVYQSITTGKFEHNGQQGAFRNWLRKVVASQLAMYRRKSKRYGEMLPVGIEESLADTESDLVRLWNEEHSSAVLTLVLARLAEGTSPESIEIFRRTFIDGESAESIAQEFGRTKNAIIVQKCKMLKKARQMAPLLLD